jgi:hypothetical protein
MPKLVSLLKTWTTLISKLALAGLYSLLVILPSINFLPSYGIILMS